MRNLKRALSLVLAAAMLIGMMVVSASAAGKDFGDQAEIKNTEAVAVMSALKVLEGTNKGDFNPTGILTREQAAKIICYMMMGPANAEKLSNNSSIFSDVAANRWSAPFIAYCANLGILAGAGDGTFNPEGELTGIAFGKMLLVALGYDAKIEGYVGKDWSTNIAVDMVSAGIAVDGIVLSDPLSRDSAAQMAFQALTANMVRYSNKGTEVTTSDGTSIVIGASDAAAVTIASEGASNYAGAGATDGSLGYQQFCEKYFPKLHKGAGVPDDFTRAAAYAWYLDKNSNNSYDAATDELVFNAAKTPVVTYTAFTLPAAIVKDLKGYTFNVTKLADATTQIGATTTAIGDLSFSSSTDVIATKLSTLTANGKVVEIYVDNTGAVTDVNVIGYKVETIDNITTATNGDKTYAFSSTADKIDYADDSVNTDTVMLHGDFAKGDVVTTYQGASYLHVYPTTVVEGAQSAYNNTYKTITVGGTVYTVATGVNDGTDAVAVADFSNSATAAKYFFDQYGYVVKTTAINNTYTNFAQLKGNYVSTVTTTVDGSTPAVQARFVLADGTVSVYDLAMDYNSSTKEYKIAGTKVFDADDTSLDSKDEMDAVLATLLADGKVFGYEVKDNKITLQAVDTSVAADTLYQGTTTSIVTGSTVATVASQNTLLDKNTVYVLYDATKGTAVTYTGALPAGATLDTAGTTVVALGSSSTLGTAKVVFGFAADLSAVASNDFAYINSSVYTTELKADGNTYRVYEGYKADGTKVTLYGDNSGSIVTTGGVYTWDNEMNVTGAYTVASCVKAAATYTVVGDQMMDSSSNVYNMENAQVVYVDSTKTTVNGNSCVVVLEVVNGSATNNAVVIYVVG
ncbi:S-layer homology domain-containing protein [Lawsonibacter celer]|uniref:S-layer homology domain-containing protein n=1 Tax=Lawsonibacter celer TaxID=2986526 RepID=UPI0016440BBE|nr:S-layer homology domain-containing protein [Lawsonibacter celer]